MDERSSRHETNQCNDLIHMVDGFLDLGSHGTFCLLARAYINTRKFATLVYMANATIAKRDLLMSGELRDVPFVSDEYFGMQ